jgi:hypothetical protein
MREPALSDSRIPDGGTTSVLAAGCRLDFVGRALRLPRRWQPGRLPDNSDRTEEIGAWHKRLHISTVRDRRYRRNTHARRGTRPLSLNGSREQTRALIPLKLALHELHPDQGRRTQRLGFAREFGHAGVKRMVVHAFPTGNTQPQAHARRVRSSPQFERYFFSKSGRYASYCSCFIRSIGMKWKAAELRV